MIALAVLASLALVASLLASFFFSGAESASISASRYRLRQMERDGNASAGRALDLLARNHRLITAILIANNFANVVGVLVFKILLDLTWPAAKEPVLGFVRADELLAIAVLTPLILVFAEILPKAIFRARADTIVLAVTPVLRFVMVLFAPAVHFLDLVVRAVMLPFGGGANPHAPRITRADVILMLNRDPSRIQREDPEEREPAVAGAPAPPPMPPEAPAAPPSFMRDPDERTLVKNIIELDRGFVRDIMRALVELDAVQLGHTSVPAFLERARRSGYSRYPAYRNRITNIVGYIDVYDVLRADGGDGDMERFVRPAHYVPETKRVDDLLKEFLDLRLKTAIVVDEYGGCAGWVTREDILEEIVGELEDELDLPTPVFREQPDGTMLVEGRIEIEHLNEVLGVEIPDDDFDTLGGYVMARLGRIPRVGDVAEAEDWRFRVLEMNGMRVGLVRAERESPESATRPEAGENGGDDRG